LSVRAISLLLAVAIALGLLFLPATRGRELTAVGHALLTPLLLVVCALFVNGVGYVPRRAWAARLLSAWLLWPLAAAIALAWWVSS
jgi:predicted membrane protein